MARKPKAVVLGVGAERGVGGGLSLRFAKEGYHVLVAGPTAGKIGKVADAIRAAGGSASAVVTDGTKEADVIALFDRAMADDAEGTPADLQTRAIEEIRRACQTDEAKTTWANQGADFPNLTGAQFDGFIKTELAKWAKVVKASGAKLD